jgi:hypothetical protein
VSAWTGVLVATAALAAVACAREATQPDQSAAAPQQAQVGDTIRLRPGGMARIGTSDVVVAFRLVEQDSRCPIDVQCVWAGDAAVLIDLTKDRRTWTPASLHSFLEPKAIEFGGYGFRLVEVTPSRVSTRPTRPEDYVIALEVGTR